MGDKPYHKSPHTHTKMPQRYRIALGEYKGNELYVDSLVPNLCKDVEYYFRQQCIRQEKREETSLRLHKKLALKRQALEAAKKKLICPSPPYN